MTSHEHTLVVDRPLQTVYNQWTQFESYPDFMSNVDDVRQIDPSTTHWKVSVGGVDREYDASILDQQPDRLISWASVDGPRQAGIVTFEAEDDARTRVTLRLDFDPQGFTERVGDALGVVSSSVENSLERFKAYIEDRGAEDGAWRGTIEGGEPVLDLRGDPSMTTGVIQTGVIQPSPSRTDGGRPPTSESGA
jgi:uncharacterized membrane protein